MICTAPFILMPCISIHSNSIYPTYPLPLPQIIFALPYFTINLITYVNKSYLSIFLLILTFSSLMILIILFAFFLILPLPTPTLSSPLPLLPPPLPLPLPLPLSLNKLLPSANPTCIVLLPFYLPLCSLIPFLCLAVLVFIFLHLFLLSFPPILFPSPFPSPFPLPPSPFSLPFRP